MDREYFCWHWKFILFAERAPGLFSVNLDGLCCELGNIEGVSTINLAILLLENFGQIEQYNFWKAICCPNSLFGYEHLNIGFAAGDHE